MDIVLTNDFSIDLKIVREIDLQEDGITMVVNAGDNITFEDNKISVDLADIDIDDEGIEVNDKRTVKTGIIYKGDYSNDFIDNSLVSKLYVDNRATIEATNEGTRVLGEVFNLVLQESVERSIEIARLEDLIGQNGNSDVVLGLLQSEVIDRTNADNQLDEKILLESQARAQDMTILRGEHTADQNLLDGKITTTNTRITNEIALVNQIISGVVSEREDAEGLIVSNFDTAIEVLSDDLTDEVTNRTSADNVLDSKIDTKENKINAGNVNQYYRGDKSWVTLNTDTVPEGNNVYFTEQRVKDTIIGTVEVTPSPIVVDDTLLIAISKLQSQITAKGNGTVTNVSATTPTGLNVNVSNSGTTPSINISLQSGYSIPTTTKQTNWDSAVTNSHTHSNKSILDTINNTLIGSWNDANTHSDETGNPHGTTFGQLLDLPTTLNDFGITDSYTILDIDTLLTGKVDTIEGYGLSETNYTQAEKDKLAGLDSSLFKGQFTSYESLILVTGELGAYAYVDGGVGENVEQYIWDNDDEIWITQSGASTSETPASIKQKYESNPDTNALTDSLYTKLFDMDGNATQNETDSYLLSRANHTGVQGVETINGLQILLDDKVDKINGYGLSQNNYTTAEKNKLTGIETGATQNSTDAQLLDRLNHVGSQEISTINGLQTILDDKVDVELGKGLSEADFTEVEKSKLAGIATGATANQSNVYLLSRANHTGTQAISTVTDLQVNLDSKVDKVEGLGLSENSFTSLEKTKLAGIATGATANDTDSNLLDRVNHTGTQAISTVTNLQTTLNDKENVSNKKQNFDTPNHVDYPTTQSIIDLMNVQSQQVMDVFMLKPAGTADQYLDGTGAPKSFSTESVRLNTFREIKSVATATYTLLATDYNKVLHFTNSSEVTVTVPTGLTQNIRFEMRQIGTGQVSVVGISGVNVRTTSVESNKTNGQYSSIGLDYIGTEEYLLYGNLELI